MRTTILGIGAGALCLFAVPAIAQDSAAPSLGPEAAAGKVIYEETAGGVGCAMCHGDDASGDIAPDIRGADPVLIFEQMQANQQMTFIDLSEEEVQQVSLYLRYLHELADH